jgi:uncharacterized protein YyaL (SSP411 family)
MRILFSIFLGLAGLACQSATLQAQPVDAVDWLDNYQEALQQAKATGKPIFLEYRCEP